LPDNLKAMPAEEVIYFHSFTIITVYTNYEMYMFYLYQLTTLVLYVIALIIVRCWNDHATERWRENYTGMQRGQARFITY
jgi:hypothetical protein